LTVRMRPDLGSFLLRKHALPPGFLAVASSRTPTVMNPNVLPPPLPLPLDPARCIGITTTVPVEIIYAAGLTPVDLNNLFITSERRDELVDEAEYAGFPRTCCCWTKGIYGATHRFGIKRLIGVVQGDCSNTHALMEALTHEGVECIPFDFPHRPDEKRMAEAMQRLSEVLGAELAEAEAWKEKLAGARALAADIDRLSWHEQRITGRENHLWLVSASDFCATPERYVHAAEQFAEVASRRPPLPCRVRLGYVGVPPIADEIYAHVEAHGGLVVYNETQRQFAMSEPSGSLREQYSRYTYPYGIFTRLKDMKREIERRSLDGVIHYTQSFCFRRIEDRILREELSVPVLTLECDRPGPLSGQVKTRLEAFVETLSARKEGRRLF